MIDALRASRNHPGLAIPFYALFAHGNFAWIAPSFWTGATASSCAFPAPDPVTLRPFGDAPLAQQ